MTQKVPKVSKTVQKVSKRPQKYQKVPNSPESLKKALNVSKSPKMYLISRSSIESLFSVDLDSIDYSVGRLVIFLVRLKFEI